MSKFTFLINDTGEYFAIPTTSIEEIPYADCYSNYGQQVGAYDAGDCITPNEDTEIKLDHWDEPQSFKQDEPITESEIIEWFEKNKTEGVDYELHQVMVQAYTYWDGHNHKTIILGGDFSECIDYNYSILEDEDIIRELEEAIENMEWEQENRGVDYYSYRDWNISESRWQGDFETYKLYK